MKSFLTFCLILGPAFAMDPEYRKTMIKSIEKCNLKFNLDPEQILSMNFHQRPPQTKAEMCFLDCALLDVGMINEKGEMQTEALQKAAKNRYNDSKDVEVALKIMDRCAATVPKNPEECEASGYVIACFINAANDAKLPPPTL